MYAERQSSLFIERIRQFGRWLNAPVPEHPQGNSAYPPGIDRYAGLGVDPHSFSDQLCKLQVSLLKAGNPQAPPAIKTAANGRLV